MSYGDFDNQYHDGPEPRGCEKCGNDGMDKAKPEPMLAEVQLAFGLLSWICYDCRKDWHKMIKTHELQDQYAAATLRLELWKSLADSGKIDDMGAFDEGFEYLRTVNKLELQINDVANEWLIN